MTKQKRGEVTKEQIEEAALELFCKSGFDGTSVDDIATLANITKGALYYYFKNKIELFNAVCQKAMESYQKEVFDKSALRASSESGIKVLIINSHLFDLERSKYSMLYLKMAGEDWNIHNEPYSNFRTYFESYRNQVQTLIIEDRSRGIIQPIDVDAASTLLLAILDGMSIRNTAYSRGFASGIDIEVIADMALKGFQ